MDNFIKVKTVAEKLDVSTSFIRKIINKDNFKNLIIYDKFTLINFNEEFIEKINKYMTTRCCKKYNKKEQFAKNSLFNKIINSDTLLKWTLTAIDCYKIRCNCNKCNLYQTLNTKCQMKNIVVELVKKFGAPNIERNDIL